MTLLSDFPSSSEFAFATGPSAGMPLLLFPLYEFGLLPFGQPWPDESLAFPP